MDQRKKVFRATQTVNKAMVSLDPAIIRMEIRKNEPYLESLFKAKPKKKK